MRQPPKPPNRGATPQPTALPYNPTQDEFQAWCENPTTQWVAKAYAMGIAANERLWNATLRNGPADPAILASLKTELHTRIDAYEAFLNTTHADYLQLIDPQGAAKTYGQK